jgi:hypothetical protein
MGETRLAYDLRNASRNRFGHRSFRAFHAPQRGASRGGFLSVLRCRVLGHKVAKSRWFFLTERRQRCERCGKRVSARRR